MNLSEAELKKKRRRRLALLVVILMPALMTTVFLRPKKMERPIDRIGFHQAEYDRKGKLLPWTGWEKAMETEMNWYYNAPAGKSGYPVYFYSTFIDSKYHPYKTDIIPSTQLGMGIISYLKFWEYTGKKDTLALRYARWMGEFLARDASTPDTGFYPLFPRSTGNHEEIPLIRSSQGDVKYGDQVIEPDKGGIAGYAYLLLYRKCGDEIWKTRAEHVADILVRNMRTGSLTRSPWPFRVDAVSGKYWGERNGNMVYILRLLDGLKELGLERFSIPRDKLWQWIKDCQFKAPETREGSLWIQFFEDMTEEDNRNSWAPLEMARYLIEQKDKLDPDWKAMAGQCIGFSVRYFAIHQPGGVTLMGEQDSDKRPWGGACSKLGGVAAMFYAAGGGDEFREIALRNLNWVTYFIDSDGGPAAMCDLKEWRKGSWQEDCHTDVVHNFMDALSAVPEFRSGH